MDIVKKITELVFNKSFLLGVALAVGIFSKYIFGDDNLAEELSELFVFKTTGQDVDFSPDSEEKPEQDLNEFFNTNTLHH